MRRQPACRQLSAERADGCIALCPAAGTNRLAGVIAPAAQRGTEGDHGDRGPQVQPVVRVIDGNEFGPTVVIDDKATNEEHQIHDAPTDEVRAGTVEGAGQCNPRDTECQMHQVVQYRHVEDSEKSSIGMMAGEGELVIIRGDARNGAEHADDQKHCADGEGGRLDGVPNLVDVLGVLAGWAAVI